MGKLTLDEIVRARDTPGRSLLLFLTDRCPVGCAHCSVDSRRDSPSISDHALLAELVAAICADSERQVIGISGGEPFVERRGLSLAVDALAGAGKDVVVYTSGVWARGGESPAWIRAVLRAASCVFLSTDAFHAASIGEQRFVSAARSIAAEGTPLVVQVMDLQDQVGAARRLLGLAFGADWPAQAELSLTPSLPYGRGAEVFALAPLRSVPTLGRCPALSAPVVRYDGQVIACCNEQVIMGHGPSRLRRTCRSGAELAQVLAAMRQDPLLRLLSVAGPAGVAAHPGYEDLTAGAYRGVCDFCWRAQERTAAPLGSGTDVLIEAMAITLAPGVAAS